MSEGGGDPWYKQLPAKVAAGVVFMVGLTTLAGNVLELDDKRRQREAEEARAAAAAARQSPHAVAAVAAPPAQPSKRKVVVERIVTRHDGTPGTTDWRFTVEADGEPLFAFTQDDLDDTGGRNIAAPGDAGALLRLDPGQSATLLVKGWRRSRLRMDGGEPHATGQGTLTADGRIAPVHVVAADPQAGDFMLHFSADEQR